MAAQAVAAIPAIPAPLTGVPFMKASHFQLGAEPQAPVTARQPFSHSQFPPRWGVFRPPPAPLPCSGHVLGPPGGDSGETCSETRLAFPEKPLQPVAPFVPPESCVRMHSDPHVRVLTSETRDSFPCPQSPQLPPGLPAAQLQKDNIPCGDREKIRLPASIYSTSYPAHGVQPARPRPSRWGCVPTIRGDGQSYYNTSYQAQFKGEWSPPAKPSGKHISSIKFGDPTSSGFTSEQKYAYTAPDKKGHRVYDKEHAVSQIHQTNVRLGDGCSRFSTSTSELFPAHEPEPVTTVRPNKNASSILRGDEDPERNRALTATTTTRLSYPETDRWNFTLKPDVLLQKHRSNICLGDERSGSRFFNTTHQTDYQPHCQGQRVMADGKNHRESHIPFDYHNERSVTTTQAMLVPHRQQKQRLSEDMLQQMKSSHLELPWKVPDLFRTEQRDVFTPKSRGPAEISNANCQVSSVPLGTLKKYCPKRRVHFTP
ncbi:stabilizer of axonemal microtubules 5 [Caloenas nicobarica]|uniref:stabilizer of axonemal microtubules 5 n=1 Tax=Caloenas nicobarica TaxID=187106 RepID=UPI0032B7D8FE